MSFTVVWEPSALNELGNIWLQASDRRAVADAADEMDRVLRSAPLSVGEPYDEDRHLAVEPLEVVYSVSTDDNLVKVLSVWHT